MCLSIGFRARTRAAVQPCGRHLAHVPASGRKPSQCRRRRRRIESEDRKSLCSAGCNFGRWGSQAFCVAYPRRPSLPAHALNVALPNRSPIARSRLPCRNSIAGSRRTIPPYCVDLHASVVRHRHREAVGCFSSIANAEVPRKGAQAINVKSLRLVGMSLGRPT